jgi:hypothetical protein
MSKRYSEDDDANYDFRDQGHKPHNKSFANMPEKASIVSLPTEQCYRHGLINSTVKNLKDKTKIHENQR